jgi:hypothetical protein
VPNQHHDDSASRPPSDSDDTPSDARDLDHTATVLPFPRKPGGLSTQEGRWRVERIDTEPMTAQQYDRAVATLATLIGQWRRTQENGNEAHEEAA